MKIISFSNEILHTVICNEHHTKVVQSNWIDVIWEWSQKNWRPISVPFFDIPIPICGESLLIIFGVEICNFRRQSPMLYYERPMRRKTWIDTENEHYVAVSWVSMQVLINSVPSFQSFWPASVNSLARGGVDTDETIDSVVVAPNIREPPRKQTKWSCLGDICHDLLFVGEAP